MEQYNDIIKTKIGKPIIKVTVSNPFPVIDEKVTIDSKSKWSTTHNYKIDDGSNITEKDIPSVLGSSDSYLITTKDQILTQSVTVENTEGVSKANKNLYCMAKKTKPYFDILASKEIIRNDGEFTHFIIISENGYELKRDHTIVARIYKENEEENPIHTITSTDFSFNEQDQSLSSVDIKINIRGIYDIEVDITDTLTEEMTSKRINKLITVTPKLAERGKAIEFLIPDAKKSGSNVSEWELHGENYPIGSTIILKEDIRYGVEYPKRLRFMDFQGTEENPYVITIDQSTPLLIKWFYYFGLNLENCKHIVFDGRGYQNISKGFLLKPLEGEGKCESAISSGNGSTDFEMFEIEVDGADFAGLFLKTDPDPNKPEFWYPTFKMNKLLLHHNHIHDTGGEGSYIGHFNMSPYTKTNNQNKVVTYRAHHIYDSRIYRCLYENQGYDSLQWNNAENLEICYNKFINGGYRGEQDQASGLSLGLSGKIYNNTLINTKGPCIQFGTLGRLDIFNNILVNGTSGHMGLLLLATAEVPEQNPNEQGFNELPLYIYNNMITTETRPPLTSRNTTQYLNVHFVDNFCIQTDTPMFSGQKVETMKLWEGNAKGNVSSVQKITDYNLTDNTYKFGDSINGDYRINSDSSLIDKGVGKFFKFDYRGYKNWYSNIFPSGAYMGIYRNDGMDERFRILSITFDGDVDKKETISDYVYISWTHYGDSHITEYRISEKEDMEGVEWKPYLVDEGGQYKWSFSPNKGLKTIYLQLKNQQGEITPIKGDTITWLSRKVIVGINSSSNPTTEGDFDDISKISIANVRYQVGKNIKIKDVLGVHIGTISVNRSRQIYDSEGLISGDNSGIYPDIILRKNEASDYKVKSAEIDPPTIFTITIPKGIYTLRLFANSNRSLLSGNISKLLEVTPFFIYECNGVKVRAVSLYNNMDQIIEVNRVTIGEDGLLTIKMYWDEGVFDKNLIVGLAVNVYGSLNCIEIEEEG